MPVDKYAKIEGGKVTQVQPHEGEGFVKVHGSIVCGMVHDGTDSYAKKSFSAPAPELTWNDIRITRDALLSRSDWTQLSDSPHYQDDAWVSYRQSLRDITDTFGSPDDVVWPSSP